MVVRTLSFIPTTMTRMKNHPEISVIVSMETKKMFVLINKNYIHRNNNFFFQFKLEERIGILYVIIFVKI